MKFNAIFLMNPLLGHWSTQCLAHPPITTASRIPIDGLVSSTWCFRLRMDFDMETSAHLSHRRWKWELLQARNSTRNSG